MSEPRRILVVEDELDLAELLRYNLNIVGHRADVVHNGLEAIEAARREKPDLIILDIMLPEVDGLEVAKQLKAADETAQVPIIFLTAKSSDDDQITGLDLGADDYVTKPFSVKVLLARVEAALRRNGQAENNGSTSILEIGPVRVDTELHEVAVDSEHVSLTLTEFRLLAALMAGPGRVLSRRGLIADAIGPGITVTERTIDVHVAAIRKKLGEHGSMIKTVRGVGYRIIEPDG